MGLSTNQPRTQVEHSGSSNSGEISPAAPPPTKMQPQTQQQSTNKLNCPRCDSRNTKFCYYNNYNKSQPRHFCKSCRRYWTAGGTLRNIPVGGGRKNKRHKPPPAAATKGSKKISDSSFECINKLTQMESQAQNPTKRLISLGFGLDDENGTYINGGIGGSNNFPPPHTHNDELQFPCSISASGYFPDLYGCCSNGESCALEETAMTDVGPSLGLSSLNEQPWKYMESINSSWVWDDIDKLVSSDFSLPWDDAESN